jgi:HK97 family phage portal protein
MESKLSIWQKTKNALTSKSAYNLPPEIFQNDRYGSNTRFRLFGDFMNYGIGKNSQPYRYMKAFKKSPLVYMIVNKLTTTTSSIKLVAVDPMNRDERIEESRLLEFLNSPNLTQNEKEFRQSIYQSLSLDGNAYIYRSDTMGMEGDFMAEVWNPAFVCPKISSTGMLMGWKYTDTYDQCIEVGFDEMDKLLHIKTSNIAQCDPEYLHLGISPLEAMWIIVQSSDEKFNAEASIFKNRGIIGILTNKSEVPMLKKERERLQNEFDEEVGGSDRFNKIKISMSALEYIQTGMSPTDLKLLEGITSSLRQLCAAYGLPSVLFNDNDNSTYNNVREAKITAYMDAYLPLCEMVNDKLSPWLSDALGVSEYLVPDLTQIDVLKNTTNKVMTALNSLDPSVARTLVAALRINDVLDMLGVEQLEMGGDELLGSGSQQTTTQEDGNV